MKIHIILAFLLFLSAQLFGQNRISGEVFDDQNNTLEAAVISLINSNSKKFIKAAISNSQGKFSLDNVSKGAYQIKIETLGFKVFLKNISVSTSMNLGKFVMIMESETLDEVTIRTEKPMVQVLADKTVFNVQNTINAAGDSGFDLLRKAPGIIVDNNDNVIVEGKTGVLFFIDGKPSVLRGQDLVNFLKTLHQIPSYGHRFRKSN